jgi:RNA-directed DNA polymerase
VNIRLAQRSLDRIVRRIRSLTHRTIGQSLEQLCHTLNPVITGWVNYFALADAKAHMQRLDEYLRRRLRQVLWKQWKTPANRYRNLHVRGVSEFWAIRTAGTSKGCWRLSASPPLQHALNLAFWQETGLKSFFLHYQLRHS